MDWQGYEPRIWSRQDFDDRFQDLDLLTVSAVQKPNQTATNPVLRSGERICMEGVLEDFERGVTNNVRTPNSVCTAEPKVFTREYYWNVVASKCTEVCPALCTDPIFSHGADIPPRIALQEGAQVYVPRRTDPIMLHGSDGYVVVEDIFVVKGARSVPPPCRCRDLPYLLPALVYTRRWSSQAPRSRPWQAR